MEELKKVIAIIIIETITTITSNLLTKKVERLITKKSLTKKRKKVKRWLYRAKALFGVFKIF